MRPRLVHGWLGVVLLMVACWGCLEESEDSGKKSVYKTSTEDAAKTSPEDAEEKSEQWNKTRHQNEAERIEAFIARDPSRGWQELMGGVYFSSIPQERLSSMGPALSSWAPQLGDFVHWDWTAYDLDGDSLLSGKGAFQLGYTDTVPRVFHDLAPTIGHEHQVSALSPSEFAFRVRGIPGKVSPYTPVRFEAIQERSVRDTMWWGQVIRAEASEQAWLRAFGHQVLDETVATSITPDVWAMIHKTMDEPIESGQVLNLAIRTSDVFGTVQHTTHMEWVVGAPDQLVPGVELAMSEFRDASALTVWVTSEQAFGTDGIPSIGLEAHAPVRFDIEVE